MIFFFACKDEAGRQLKIVIAAMNKVPFITYCTFRIFGKDMVLYYKLPKNTVRK